MEYNIMKMINKIEFIEFLKREKRKTENIGIFQAINYLLNEISLYYNDNDLFSKKCIKECFKELKATDGFHYDLVIHYYLGI